MKACPRFTDSHQRPQRNHLKATRVSQHWLAPGGKLVQATKALNPLVTRSQIEVVRVRQDDLCADRVQVIWIERLHGGIRPDGHEIWRLNRAVRKRQRTGAST